MYEIMYQIFSLTPFLLVILAVAFIIRKRDKKIFQDVLLASFRTTIQLIFLAFALESIFKNSTLIVVLLVSLIMTFNSSYQIISRTKTSKYKIFYTIFLSTILSLWPIAYFLSFDKSPSSWIEAKSLLPVLGLVLGNSFNGVSIAINHFLSQMREKKSEVLSFLALGAEMDEAIRPYFYSSLRAGITPLLNSMLAMGIVSIPGMMAGQLMAQTSPFIASLTQIKFMLSLLVGIIIFISISLKYIKSKIFLPTGELCLE